MALYANPRSVLIREPNLLVPGKKPIGQVKIDWSNPVTNELICCLLFNDPNVLNTANPHNKGHVDATYPPVYGIYNGITGYDFQANSDATGGDYLYIFDGTTQGGYKQLPQWSWLAIATKESLGTVATASPALVAQRDLSNSNCQPLYHLPDFNFDNGEFAGANNASTTTAFSKSDHIATLGQIYTYGSTYDDDGDRTVRLFVDGNETGYTTQTSAVGSRNSNDLEWTAGDRIGQGRGLDGKIYFIAGWKRKLSDSEMCELTSDPYQFLVPA